MHRSGPHDSSDDPLVLRSPRWIRVTAVFAAILFGIVAIVLWTMEPRSLLSWCSVGLAIIGVGGVVSTMIQRVTLTPDRLELRTLGRSVGYPRTDIERVVQERGSQPALLLSGGTWVRLFELDTRSVRRIRTWINQA
jgi:hypothetical protein